MGKAAALGFALLLATACNVSTTRRKPIVEPESAPPPGGTRSSVQYAHANDAPEISRGVGDAGTVVVLWPRVLPKTDDPKAKDLAERVQIKLDQLAAKSGKKVDKRPAPERVCPKGEGSKGVSLGAVLAIKDKGCAVVALVSEKLICGLTNMFVLYQYCIIRQGSVALQVCRKSKKRSKL